MNRLSIKRIAVLAGALLVGAAIAGSVSFSNIPIINSAGQPVVQIVVGSGAKPSDGVVAANIAAVIGNLAYTSTPVTATVQNQNAVKCVPASTAVCTVTNQQVYLGETGIAAPSGSYAFSGLIGSVLNRADKLGIQQYSKTLQSSGQYTYNAINSTTASPAASPYFGTTVPISIGVTANYNGGGVSFSGFGSGTYDNILRVTPTEVPSLASNFGPGGENEYLWVTGFPVYDQNAKSFALLDAGGALQLVFSKPIPLMTTSNSVNNAVINIAGQNWTIIGGNYMGANVVSSTSFVQIGTLDLAQSMTPLT
ncbi:MAG: S-layer protein, partial [Candidatus Micrarchaeaceae archaeon]